MAGAFGVAGERSMVPPCLRMMPCETQRPRPVPRSPLVVKKGWKRRVLDLRRDAGPLSTISTMAPASGTSACGLRPAGLWVTRTRRAALRRRLRRRW